MKEFEEIYDLYFTDVYRYILALSKNKIIAEEIVQDTFYRALTNIEGLNDSSKIKTWLFRIAKNTFLNYISKNKKHITIDEIEIASSNNIEIEFLNKDKIKKIRKILHTIKEPYKEVFHLRVFANLSFREIAEIFDKNENWARQTFHRSKLMIKEEL